MENQASALKQLRQKRFLTVLPIIVLPFITLMFWAMGGGKVQQVNASTAKGINNILPDANLKDDKDQDKLSYYEKAQRDSASIREQMKNDPNYGMDAQTINPALEQGNQYTSSYQAPNNLPYQSTGYKYNDLNEAKVYQKLQQLDQAMNQPSPMPQPQGRAAMVSTVDEQAIERLEQMMQQMQGATVTDDPETKGLNDMLESVLDIKHPERVKEKLRKISAVNRNQVFAVTSAIKADKISMLDKQAIPKLQEETGFYSLDEVTTTGLDQNAIDAVVHETQVIVNGSTVKLRLLDDLFINGKLIPKDHFIYGTASLEGERLAIKISGIKFKKSLFPVALAVVDIDGMEGIYIPGAIAREVAKESADRAIQNVSFGGMSDNIGIQAASTGVEAAKSLFSKKLKLIKVNVKAGYRVLLFDEKQKMEQ